MLAALAGLTFLTSCEGNHFANPLPIDSKNLYEVPPVLRGNIMDDNDSLVAYHLGKNYITLMIKERKTNKIFNGIWFHPKDTMTSTDTAALKKISQYPSYESVYTIRFDSLHHPIDTIKKYIMKENKIYEISSNGIEPGFPYALKGDTIYVTPEPQKVFLGTGAFFRKVADNLYLINIRDSEVEIGSIHWWQIRLLEKRKDGKIILYEWSDQIEKDSSLIYSYSDHNYFDSQWTKKDILRLLKDSVFVATNIKK
jgi:hypothetical protein